MEDGGGHGDDGGGGEDESHDGKRQEGLFILFLGLVSLGGLRGEERRERKKDEEGKDEGKGSVGVEGRDKRRIKNIVN
jgi:hypothetical protein